jgi:hypothetical protein
LDKKYLAHFIENDIKNRVIYSQKGYMNYVVSYGEYKITQIAFYKLAGRNIWVSNLENLNHMVLVRMEDDEKEEVDQNTRSK